LRLRAGLPRPDRGLSWARGRVSLSTDLDTWHPKYSRDIGHLLICSR
jgi:hypothetical protein